MASSSTTPHSVAVLRVNAEYTIINKYDTCILMGVCSFIAYVTHMYAVSSGNTINVNFGLETIWVLRKYSCVVSRIWYVKKCKNDLTKCNQTGKVVSNVDENRLDDARIFEGRTGITSKKSFRIHQEDREERV